MQINIKELVHPQFKEGDTAYARHEKNVIRKITIRHWEITIKSYHEHVTVRYMDKDTNNWYEDTKVFATADEALA